MINTIIIHSCLSLEGGEIDGMSQVQDHQRTSTRRPRVRAEVTRAIAVRVLSGQYTPGMTLPTENEMGVEFGVSRTVIREALKVLAAKGLILTRPRVGTVVRESDSWSLLDPQIVEWRGCGLFDIDLLAAVLETRRALEPLAAALAAERATLREIADLDTAWRQMNEAGEDVERFSLADVEFHRILYRASHNPVIRQIGALIDAALKYSFETSNKTVFKRDEAIRCHHALVEALRMRDKTAAAAAATNLINQATHDIDLATRKASNE